MPLTHRSDPTRPRRVILNLAACRVYRLRQLVQEVHDWYSRWYKLAGLTILPLPGVSGDRIQAVMVWELPPSQADFPLPEFEAGAIESPRDLWRCEDVRAYEGV